MGKIELKNMEFFAHHGHYKDEQMLGNKFLVDITIHTDTEKAGKTDNIKDTIDYQEVYKIVHEQMSQPSHLLEHVAQRVLDTLYKRFSALDQVSVSISKLNPPLGGKVERFSITLGR